MRSTSQRRVNQLLGKKLADGKVWNLVRWHALSDEWLVSEWEQDQEASHNASQAAETAYLTTVQRMLDHSDQTTVQRILLRYCHKFSVK